ncbi:probable RNA methyltransferase At5g51130 [Arachis duranensis]|uniref:RNA methyltransferase n=1 Tax=Arachis duranensis TaxID=130453 RepID=A0A6P4DH58_ARADU|nr:probable RNA methyltransferase At5g51130 [Arachis duranensis]
MAAKEGDIGLHQVPFQDSSESESDNNDDIEIESEKEEEKNQKKNQSPSPLSRRQYGNFRRYYEHRNEEGPEEDPRLELLRKEWFEDKECLDIGCNDGTLTISIAKMFRCQSILAIDIDPELVEQANLNLRDSCLLMQMGGSSENNSDDSAQRAAASPEKEVAPSEPSSLEKRNLLEVVTFKQENFMESQHPELYDTVTCFSVTQWIHLNFGDQGLITFFNKIWEVLRPGGVLLLEPQAWRSYSLNHYLSPVAKKNYSEIEIRPKDFQKILLNKIGFRTVEHINSGWIDAKHLRFNRPVLVFKK